jgi:hypothetical protein
MVPDELWPSDLDYAPCAVCGLATSARLSVLPEGKSMALHARCFDTLAIIPDEPDEEPEPE